MTEDRRSRLGQFYWDCIEGVVVPVILRDEEDRYVSKMLMEVLLFRDMAWNVFTASSGMQAVQGLKSFRPTEAEVSLIRHICDQHLMERLNEYGNHHTIKNLLTEDFLLEYADFLRFVEESKSLLRKLEPGFVRPSVSIDSRFRIPLMDEAAVTASGAKPVSWGPRPSFRVLAHPTKAPAPQAPRFAPPAFGQHAMSSQTTSLTANHVDLSGIKSFSGWVQINNVFLPYVKKTNQTIAHPHDPRNCILPLSTRFYVPLQILLRCGVVVDQQQQQQQLSRGSAPDEFKELNLRTTASNFFRELSVKATKDDSLILNKLIQLSKVEADELFEGCHLVNLHHLLYCSSQLLYAKYLNFGEPKSSVLKKYKDIITCLQTNKAAIGFIRTADCLRVVPFIRSSASDQNVVAIRSCVDSVVAAAVGGRHLRVATAAEVDLLNMAFVFFGIDRDAVKNRFTQPSIGTSPLLQSEELVLNLNIFCQLTQATTMQIIQYPQTTLEQFRGSERLKIVVPMCSFAKYRRNPTGGEQITTTTTMTFGEYLLYENCGCIRANGNSQNQAFGPPPHNPFGQSDFHQNHQQFHQQQHLPYQALHNQNSIGNPPRPFLQQATPANLCQVAPIIAQTTISSSSAAMISQQPAAQSSGPQNFQQGQITSSSQNNFIPHQLDLLHASGSVSFIDELNRVISGYFVNQPTAQESPIRAPLRPRIAWYGNNLPPPTSSQSAYLRLSMAPARPAIPQAPRLPPPYDFRPQFQPLPPSPPTQQQQPNSQSIIDQQPNHHDTVQFQSFSQNRTIDLSNETSPAQQPTPLTLLSSQERESGSLAPTTTPQQSMITIQEFQRHYLPNLSIQTIFEFLEKVKISPIHKITSTGSWCLLPMDEVRRAYESLDTVADCEIGVTRAGTGELQPANGAIGQQRRRRRRRRSPGETTPAVRPRNRRKPASDPRTSSRPRKIPSESSERFLTRCNVRFSRTYFTRSQKNISDGCVEANEAANAPTTPPQSAGHAVVSTSPASEENKNSSSLELVEISGPEIEEYLRECMAGMTDDDSDDGTEASNPFGHFNPIDFSTSHSDDEVLNARFANYRIADDESTQPKEDDDADVTAGADLGSETDTSSVNERNE